MEPNILALKIAIRALVVQSRMLRHAEREAKAQGKGAAVNYLHNRRTVSIRTDARCAQLAYACLRGKPYAKTEKSTKRGPNWKWVSEMYLHFGGDPGKPGAARDPLDEWRFEGIPLPAEVDVMWAFEGRSAPGAPPSNAPGAVPAPPVRRLDGARVLPLSHTADDKKIGVYPEKNLFGPQDVETGVAWSSKLLEGERY